MKIWRWKMKVIFGSRRYHCLARVSLFPIIAALIAGMAGCVLTQCNLTISSTEGGEVTIPGEGTFAYDEGTMVDLVADADDDYRFVKWTGNVSAIADVNADATTITMHDSYFIAANFEEVDPGTLFAGGDGTEENPYQIANWHHLYNIREYLSKHFILMNDLDSTTAGHEELASPTANGEKGWEPIGGWEYGGFIGTFDGQGYEIHDLYINRPDESDAGLFGIVDETGIIENIGVTATVTGYTCVGGLVGEMGINSAVDYGTVRNCYATGSVTGDGLVGGLVGVTWKAVVSNSYYTGSVNGDEWVSGLVGRSFGDVSNSFYNYDEVLINGENIITIGALFSEDFEEWLANDKFLDVNDRLSQESGYYVMNDVDDFKQLLAFGQNSSLKFRLKNDLDLSTASDFYIPYLAGEFDGNGHRISNLSFNFDFISQVGLFGYLAPGGNVTDLAVENISITGASIIGGLAGDNVGKVSNSYSTGDIIGYRDVGGLVGSNWGTVNNCYSTGSVTGTVGYLSRYVGGLVGRNVFEGTVSSSYATSSVTGGADVGGLAGESFGNVSKSYSSSNVTGESRVGGLIGQHGGSVSDSFSAGSVTGNEDIGGLVGGNNGGGAVSNSYSTCSVTGSVCVGGLMGYHWGTVTTSYSTGNVDGDVNVGGLVGAQFGSSTVSNSFWDTETSGQTTSDGGTGKTTAEMRDTATFSGAGWDIIAVVNSGTRNPAYIWNIVDGATYPFLSWQP
jgi:hypothetical protein